MEENMTETTFSWESLEEFVGREKFLTDAKTWLQDDALHLVFYTGDYGVGKTRLLKQILESATNLRATAVPVSYIDLYHNAYHSDEGLALALADNFREYKEYFFAFDLAKQALDKARAASDSQKAAGFLRAMLNSCADGIMRLSQDQGILILLDTAERWVYPTAEEGLSMPPAWAWFKSWVKQLDRGMVVLAGRSQCNSLAVELGVHPVQLDFFTQGEIQEYIQAVLAKYSAKTNSADFEITTAEIDSLTKLSDGRPILIALYLQLVFQNKQLRDKLCSVNREVFEKFLMDELMSSEVGEALRAAGRAPKGVDLDLFASIRGLPPKNVKDELEQLKSMSFAKTFKSSNRLFLHDEMYAMLQRHIYADKGDYIEATEAARKIYEYYRKLIFEKNQELQSLYEQLVRGIEFEEITTEQKERIILDIRALEMPRQLFATEFISYQWRHSINQEKTIPQKPADPVEIALRDYYRFAHESATTGRYDLTVALRLELLSILKELTPQDNPWRGFIRGLLLVQQVWENLALGEKYGVGIPSLLRKLETIRELDAAQRTVLAALLKTWQGTAIIFSLEPVYENAAQLLTEAITALQKIDKPEMSWFKMVTNGLAHRQRAYLYRIQGQFDLAIADYLEALKHNRGTNYFHEEATLRNDLGVAQMMVGKFQSARENIEEGLKLRYRLGAGPYIALSNSTLAQYLIATTDYDGARKSARDAVRISQAIGFERGEAFGKLALAEATRRYAFSPKGLPQQTELIDQAEKLIKSAVNSFEKLGEQLRIIESYLEQACVARDKMRILAKEHQDTWYNQALEGLQKTAGQAKKWNITYRNADALGNIIWLNIFAGKLAEAEQAADRFAAMPELTPYWLHNGRPTNVKLAELNPILWSQIGKFYAAKGVLAFEKRKLDLQSSRNGMVTKGFYLNDCALNFLLALQYSSLFALDHRGIREGRRTIFDTLTKLNPTELTSFSEYVRQGVVDQQLSPPIIIEQQMREQGLWFGA
jgi:hypothetical protein